MNDALDNLPTQQPDELDKQEDAKSSASVDKMDDALDNGGTKICPNRTPSGPHGPRSPYRPHPPHGPRGPRDPH